MTILYIIKKRSFIFPCNLFHFGNVGDVLMKSARPVASVLLFSLDPSMDLIFVSRIDVTGLRLVLYLYCTSFCSDKGTVYSARAYRIPECSRAAAGTPLVQVLP